MEAVGRKTRMARAIGCALLLTLLAVCGFVGAKREPQTLSVALTRSTLATNTARSTPQEIAERLQTQREQEIALLDSVIANDRATSAARESALAQKTDIAARMEAEAQILAALSYMGYQGVSVVCGTQMATLFVPEEIAARESERTRILDMAATQLGVSAQEIKIIALKAH